MEIKVVLQVKDGKAIIGVQSPGMDPVFRMVEGDLAGMLNQVPAIVAAAQEHWKTAPKNPSISIPQPAPVPAPAGGASKAKPVPNAAPQRPMF